MNDFTKQELEEIQEIARHCCKQAVDTRHNLTYEVKKKAEAMLDSYCPHAHIIPEFGHVTTCTECKQVVGGSRIAEENQVKLNIPEYEYAREGDVVAYKIKGVK